VDVQVALIAALGVCIALLGGAIVFLSFSSYRRTRSGTMLYVSIGFAFMTAGGLAEGILYQFFGYRMAEAHFAESAVSLVGLAVLTYGLSRRRPSAAALTEEDTGGDQAS
jgi:hypothetical protein